MRSDAQAATHGVTGFVCVLCLITQQQRLSLNKESRCNLMCMQAVNVEQCCHVSQEMGRKADRSCVIMTLWSCAATHSTIINFVQ